VFDIGLCVSSAVLHIYRYIFRAEPRAEGSHPSIRHSKRRRRWVVGEWVVCGVGGKITRAVRVTPSVTNLTMFQVGS
jgi:hypothetical protein